MYEYWFIYCDKCSILMEDVNWGNCEVYGNYTILAIFL